MSDSIDSIENTDAPVSEPVDQPVFIEGGVAAAEGFLVAGIASGVKKSGKRDLALVAAKGGVPVPAAAVFTQSSMAAAPVQVSREHIADGTAQAVVINAGNANACTGARGLADARAMATATAQALECTPADVIVGSTGVIGQPLPIDLIVAGIAEAAEELDVNTGTEAAEAIMTTDTHPKEIAVQLDVGEERYVVGGMAKGVGMIMPNMATMLAVITTDAPLTSAACNAALRAATNATFNRITVDGDTSTNDMAVLMASGGAGGAPIDPDSPAFAPVAAAIKLVCAELARMIVRDGEGATKLIEVTVRGAASEADAHACAMSIANSPLFKTAIFGGDANWGRVAMAVGKSPAAVDPDKLDISFAGLLTCQGGMPVPFSEEEAAAALAEDCVEVVVDLHMGDAEVTVWTCDLTYEYVRINGEYRS